MNQDYNLKVWEVIVIIVSWFAMGYCCGNMLPILGTHNVEITATSQLSQLQALELTSHVITQNDKHNITCGDEWLTIWKTSDEDWFMTCVTYPSPTSTFNFKAPAVDHSQDVKTVWACYIDSQQRLVVTSTAPIAILERTGAYYCQNSDVVHTYSCLCQSNSDICNPGVSSFKVQTIASNTPTSLGYSDCQLIN